LTQLATEVLEKDLIGCGDITSTVYAMYRVGAVHRVSIAQHPMLGRL
jgi:hypothetical protein